MHLLAGAACVLHAQQPPAIVLQRGRLYLTGRHLILKGWGRRGRPCAQDRPEEAPAEAAPEADAHVARLYGELLGAPPERALAPDQARQSVGSAEGALALGEGVRRLLGGPVEFAHKAHHRLLPVRCAALLWPPRILCHLQLSLLRA